MLGTPAYRCCRSHCWSDEALPAPDSSALFHTKPSSHDKKLVKEGFSRALLVPLHAKFWRQKVRDIVLDHCMRPLRITIPTDLFFFHVLLCSCCAQPWFYETATALYALHAVAVGIYLYLPEQTSALSGFEVLFPICLLVLVAIGYGRVSSTLQAGDSDPSLKIMSPTKHAPQHSSSTASDVASASTASGLGSDLAESENSDSTDSDDDSGNSSSSSDEEAHRDMFEPVSTAASTPAPTPTSGVRGIAMRSVDVQAINFCRDGMTSLLLQFTAIPSPAPGSPRLPRTMSEREVGGDPFSRRRVKVCVWEDGFPTKKAMSVAELRNTILAKVSALC